MKLTLENSLIDNINDNRFLKLDQFLKIKFRHTYPQIVMTILDYIWNYRNEEDDDIILEHEYEIKRQISQYGERYDEAVLKYTSEKFYFLCRNRKIEKTHLRYITNESLTSQLYKIAPNLGDLRDGFIAERLFQLLSGSIRKKVYLNDWLRCFMPLIEDYEMDKLNIIFRILDCDNDSQLDSVDLEKLFLNMIIKNGKTYEELKLEDSNFIKSLIQNPDQFAHSCQNLIDYYIECNKFTNDVSRTRQQMLGYRHAISFREFISMIDDSYIIKEISHKLLGFCSCKDSNGKQIS